MPAIFDATDEGVRRTFAAVTAHTEYTAAWWVYTAAWPSSGVTRTLYLIANSGDRTNKSIVVAQKDTGEIYLIVAGTPITGAVVQPGWHAIFIRWFAPTNNVHIDVDNDSTPVSQSTAIPFNTWTFDELYLGTDPRSPTGGAAQSVAYFREWTDYISPVNEWTSPTPVQTTDLFTNTPLHADLLDTTANDHDWTAIGAGAVTFVSLGGTLTGCFGALVKMSALIIPGSFAVDNHHGVLMLKTAPPDGTGTRTIAQLQFTPQGYVYDGVNDRYSEVHARVDLKYGALPTSSDTTLSIGVADPVGDNAVGLSAATVNGARSAWYGTYKFALAFKCSSYTSGAYQADGFVKAYLNDTLILQATDIVLPRGPQAFGGGTGIQYWFGIRGDGDRVWAREVATLPTTNAEGAFVGGTPSALVFFDDFNAGSYSAWTPVSMFPGGPAPSSVHTYSDSGGDLGYGVSAYLVPPSSPSAGGIGSFDGLYRYVSFPPYDPAIAPPPEPEPEPEPGPLPPEVAPSYAIDERIIRRLRRAPHVAQENVRLFYRKIELDLERGVGLPSGQGADPLVMLRLSRDGGHTWSEPMEMSAGKIGVYTQRVIARRLGAARDTVFEVTVSDPVAWALVNAWLDLEAGTS